jgi:cystathionine gamma-synthase
MIDGVTSLYTRAVSAGRPTGDGDPLNAPIGLASNFRNGGLYSRAQGTETWTAFETAMGALEGGESVAYASGMAGAAAILTAFAPRVLVLPAASYHGVRSLVADLAPSTGVELRSVDVTDTAAVVAACAGADLVWMETPTNPTLDIADLVPILAAATEAGANTVVDATFATPVLLRPLELGATISYHSATKAIGGHSDLLLGVLSTRSAQVAERLRLVRTLHGATPGALEIFLALRGLRTLPLRVERAQQSAGVLAERLNGHTAVETVLYPGLASHPGHDVSARQTDGPGSMVSFVVRGGAAAADAVCAATRLIINATSLGGVESTMERRQRYVGDAHVNPGLIRLSVGIEDIADLWSDLVGALSTLRA